jgi:hypothetical protein
MAGRIRSHVRGNLVGYLALFVALGGSAYAAAQIGPNDIQRNAVLGKHVKKNAINTGDIRNRRGVTSRDVKNENLRSPDVKDKGLRIKDVRGLDDLLAQIEALNRQLNGPNGLARQIELLQGLIGGGGGGGVPLPDLNSFDERLDALCAQADAVNQQVNVLAGIVADIPLGDVTGFNLPDFNPAVCQG